MVEMTKKGPNISILVDGSTDVSVEEREVMYVKLLDMKTGELVACLLRLSSGYQANAHRIKYNILEIWENIDVDI